MNITDYMTITELSRLTNKSRPSIYKYILSYNNGLYDDIPYSIINLFKMILDKKGKKEIVEYCFDNFGDNTDNALLEIINLLKENKDRLDLDSIKKYVLEELNNGK